MGFESELSASLASSWSPLVARKCAHSRLGDLGFGGLAPSHQPTARYDLDAGYHTRWIDTHRRTRQLDVLGFKSAPPRPPERDHQRLIGVCFRSRPVVGSDHRVIELDG